MWGFFKTLINRSLLFQYVVSFRYRHLKLALPVYFTWPKVIENWFRVGIDQTTTLLSIPLAHLILLGGIWLHLNSMYVFATQPLNTTQIDGSICVSHHQRRRLACCSFERDGSWIHIVFSSYTFCFSPLGYYNFVCFEPTMSSSYYSLRWVSVFSDNMILVTPQQGIFGGGILRTRT